MDISDFSFVRVDVFKIGYMLWGWEFILALFFGYIGDEGWGLV